MVRERGLQAPGSPRNSRQVEDEYGQTKYVKSPPNLRAVEASQVAGERGSTLEAAPPISRTRFCLYTSPKFLLHARNFHYPWCKVVTTTAHGLPHETTTRGKQPDALITVPQPPGPRTQPV